MQHENESKRSLTFNRVQTDTAEKCPLQRPKRRHSTNADDWRRTHWPVDRVWGAADAADAGAPYAQRVAHKPNKTRLSSNGRFFVSTLAHTHTHKVKMVSEGEKWYTHTHWPSDTKVKFVPFFRIHSTSVHMLCECVWAVGYGGSDWTWTQQSNGTKRGITTGAITANGARTKFETPFKTLRRVALV